MACLGNELKSLVFFDVAPKYCISDSFCWLWGLPCFFYGVLARSSRYNGHLNYIRPFPSILGHWFIRRWCLFLPSPAWPRPVYLDSWTWHSSSLCNIVFCSIRFYFHHQMHPHWEWYLLWPSHLVLSGVISSPPLIFPSSILDTFKPVGVIFWCHIFFDAVHEVLTSNILGWLAVLPWITFCQNYQLWPIHLGWPCTAWLTTLSSYTSPFAMKEQWKNKLRSLQQEVVLQLGARCPLNWEVGSCLI